MLIAGISTPASYDLTTTTESQHNTTVNTLDRYGMQYAATWDHSKRQGCIRIPVKLKGKSRFIDRHGQRLRELGFQMCRE